MKKVAAINDLSGFGRCSITVALPVLSAHGVQCCPVPTAILSNHTGFGTYFFDDYSDKMMTYIDAWENLGLDFDCIYTGFLGSEKQIDIVENFIKKSENSWVLVDPVMADDGEIYSTYTPVMCEKMKRLVSLADVVTPKHLAQKTLLLQVFTEMAELQISQADGKGLLPNPKKFTCIIWVREICLHLCFVGI